MIDKEILRPNVSWIEDSFQNLSCHANLPNLSYNVSLIGTIEFRQDKWHAILADQICALLRTDKKEIGSYSYHRARLCMEEYYNKYLKNLFIKKFGSK